MASWLGDQPSLPCRPAVFPRPPDLGCFGDSPFSSQPWRAVPHRSRLPVPNPLTFRFLARGPELRAENECPRVRWTATATTASIGPDASRTALPELPRRRGAAPGPQRQSPRRVRSNDRVAFADLAGSAPLSLWQATCDPRDCSSAPNRHSRLFSSSSTRGCKPNANASISTVTAPSVSALFL